MTLCKAFTKEGKPCQNFVGKNKKLYCSRHSAKSGLSTLTPKKKTEVIAKSTTLTQPKQRRIVQKGG